MPVGQVFTLQVTMAQKFPLCIIFLLGSFVFFANIYRFTTIMQFQMSDTTWTLATTCTWCVVEVACGLISACLATLRPLMRAISSQFSSGAGRSKATPSQPQFRDRADDHWRHERDEEQDGRAPFQAPGRHVDHARRGLRDVDDGRRAVDELYGESGRGLGAWRRGAFEEDRGSRRQ
ncbi:hypothetical protein IWZ03DRAFT_202930 [Phyllosticta citriasiana]|uniref:Rhodopsin domain-containing protein n=1 Tax=Phyllosticta citriasiana TaxID=595635 RepID=A0ABR1KLL1_9PEZI